MQIVGGLSGRVVRGDVKRGRRGARVGKRIPFRNDRYSDRPRRGGHHRRNDKYIRDRSEEDENKKKKVSYNIII